tara:strand:- start:2476 stop:3240 length:765 start_codon:yes stop_codon:yes gene_type:complete
MAKVRQGIKYTWYIGHINGDKASTLKAELNKIPNTELVEVYIPTVQVLKKQFKGKNHFEDVPMLLNYGFFKIPVSWGMNLEYMKSIQDGISCLVSWSKDPARLIAEEKVKFKALKEGSEDIITSTKSFNTRNDRKTHSPIAQASDKEIQWLIDMEDKLSIHSDKDLDRLKVGQVVKLKGKPFDNLEAEIVEIDRDKRKVKVKLGNDGIFNNVEVEFENVFYSVYTDDMDEKVGKHLNIDELYGNGTMDDFIIDY